MSATVMIIEQRGDEPNIWIKKSPLGNDLSAYITVESDQQVRPGDWLLTDDKGRQFVLSDEWFSDGEAEDVIYV